MTTNHTPAPGAILMERTYDAPVQLVWELLTSSAGLEQWWAPDGFETRVSRLDLRPGGRLDYTMTATALEQVAFLQDRGMPLTSELHKTFTEVGTPSRLAYLTVIDFVPDHRPYQHLTTIDVQPVGAGTRVAMTLDPLHDESWTAQHRAHRSQELDHLAAAIDRQR